MTFWKISSSGGAAQYVETDYATAIDEQLQLLFSIAKGSLLNNPDFGHDLDGLTFASQEKEDLENVAYLIATEALVNYFPYDDITKTDATLSDEGKTELEFDYQVVGVDINGSFTVTV